MAREQLGTNPSDGQDAVTKAYVDGLSTATGKSLMTAISAKEAREAIGAVSDFDLRLDDTRIPIDGSVSWEKLDDDMHTALYPLNGMVAVDTTSTQNLTNKTYTSGRFNRLHDTNGNICVALGATTNAVNYFYLFNAAAGGTPQISPFGQDADIGLTLAPKGQGKFSIYTEAEKTPTISATGVGDDKDFSFLCKGSGVLKFSNSTISSADILYSGSPLGTPSGGTLTNCTGLPISGIVSSATEKIGIGSIELGHSDDTTISRSAAGRIAVEGINLVTVSSTDTLTNKTITNGKYNGIYDTNGALVVGVGATASAANNLYIYNAATNGSPQVSMNGSDSNIGLTLVPKGTGKFTIYCSTGNTPTIVASGADSTHNLTLTPKGATTGKVLISYNNTSYPAGVKVSVPSASNTAGLPGQWAADSSYIYAYTGDGTTHSWVRSTAGSW